MMSILWLITASAIIGFGMGVLYKGKNYGNAGYVVMGIVGGLASGGFCAFFGIAFFDTWWDYIIKGAIGALIVILLSRLIRGE